MAHAHEDPTCPETPRGTSRFAGVGVPAAVVAAVWTALLAVYAVGVTPVRASAVLVGLGAVATAALAWRSRHAPGRAATVFVLLAAAQGLESSGDLVWAVDELRGVATGSVSLADVGYLASYPMLAAAVILLVWTRGGRGALGTLADSLMVGVVAAVSIWLVMFTMQRSEPWPDWLVASAYPMLGSVVLVCLAWMLMAPGGRHPVTLFLAAYMSLMVACDVVYALDISLRGPGNADLLSVGYGLTYMMLFLAATHPRASGACTGDGNVAAAVTPVMRVVLLGAGIVAMPVLGAVARGTGQIVAVTIATVLVSVAIIARIALVVMGANRDRAEAARSAADLQHRATHDSLTGMLNRAGLVTHLGELLERAGSTAAVAVLLVNIDEFKLVNDSLGHASGDMLLEATAARITSAAPPEALLARTGGDEFVVAVTVPGTAEATRLAQTVGTAVRTPLEVGDGEVYMSATMGIAVGDASASGPDLLRDADIALHRAKEVERGGWQVFGGAMRHLVAERHSLENDLRRALESDAISVAYQPQVDLRTGRVVGVEALARWHHAARGEVSPGLFIPLAEATGLIIPLGERVLEMACADARRWNTGAFTLSMSVNVSARQLALPGTVRRVETVLRSIGLPARMLALELTETALALDPDGMRRRMAALRAMGVRVELDDFGTGQSSLAALRSFPLDAVKIDRAFMDGVGVDERATRGLSAVLTLIDALGLEAVAEGVETLGHAQALVGMGFPRAQGYFYGRPVDAAAIDALLLDGHRVPTVRVA